VQHRFDDAAILLCFVFLIHSLDSFILSHVIAIPSLLICLAQNDCLVLGLLQISAPVLLGCHSCLFLMPPYKNALITLEVFSRALKEHIATNKFQLGFAIPICFLCSLQMLPLAFKLVFSLCTATKSLPYINFYFKIPYSIANYQATSETYPFTSQK
jgi:hypothetical protein